MMNDPPEITNGPLPVNMWPFGESRPSSATSLLHTAILLARDLTEPGEPNHEYIRGQVNLIMDMFGLNGDYSDDNYRELTDVISGVKTINAMRLQ